MIADGWRTVAAAIIGLALALSLAGCSNGPGEVGAEGPPANPLFYEIASADGTVEGWMLGTIHALPDGTRWRTTEIGRVIDAADFLVVEISEPRGPDERTSIYLGLAQSPDQPEIGSRLPAHLRPMLAGMMKRGDLDDRDFLQLETWAAAITLARGDATGNPANGVDRALMADFADRPVRELEGMRGQLAIFDRLPELDQRAMLAAVVSESERTRRDPARLQRAWLAGDAVIIETATHEGFLAVPALREALLTGRNQRWAEAIVPMLAERPRPLIAVGAAHLVGPDGLAALLEAQGYRIRRLP
ncbi:TraB/GumN family protein [Porphyrobacter sp. HT-58-2]|uniref:TraB/GumN family protein n=1 Tax=Porphyrobacter sp. HT-58-2 TaxID=2023229 RepID=UPI0015595ADB|nr:TraB/GumN family protein [Porphyrobacter sp. HT-58-2]